MKNLERFRKEVLEQNEFEGFFVSNPFDRTWLSGFYAEDVIGGPSGFLLVTPEKQLLMTDPRYSEQAKREASDWEIHVYRGKLAEVLGDVLESANIHTIGFDSAYLNHSLYTSLKQYLYSFSPEKARLYPTKMLTEGLRAVKTPDEINKIQKAVDVIEVVMRETAAYIEPGITELDISRFVRDQVMRYGAEDVSFTPLIASGPNGSMPHHRISRRKIRRHEPILVDIGAKVDGWCSDMTRIFFCGKPDEKVARIYQIAKEAMFKAMDAIKPGVTWASVDTAARDHIEDFGFVLPHSTGHGIGLAVHERPTIGYQYTDEVLVEGMVVAVEPGIYPEDTGGLRLENMIVVTNDGYRLMNTVECYYDC